MTDTTQSATTGETSENPRSLGHPATSPMNQGAAGPTKTGRLH